MKVLLIALCITGTMAHDIQVAFFKFYQVDGALTMEFVLEKEDVIQALSISNSKLSNETLKTYLGDNFSLSINSVTQNLSYGDMVLKNKHIYIKSNLSKPPTVIKTLAIENTCLLSIDNHSNIVEFRIDGQERDFLMNRDRTTIDIEL